MNTGSPEPRKQADLFISDIPDYRRLPPGYHHIPYAEFRANWGRWERERYWDRDIDWRAGWHGRPYGRGFEERGREYEEHGRYDGRRG
jgi:hypothetical protein